jgi:protein-S-isoprenylcysteine O-methyltransferase Ste14
MCLGPAIQFGLLHYWLGVLVIGLGLWIKLKQEETIMLRHFPEYAGYRQRVKALVPFVV